MSIEFQTNPILANLSKLTEDKIISKKEIIHENKKALEVTYKIDDNEIKVITYLK